jgi:hypothetical protein
LLSPDHVRYPESGGIGRRWPRVVLREVAPAVARDNIAGNTLWPRTIIESQASANWKMAGRPQWRTPEILCDAAMAIFAQERRFLSGSGEGSLSLP